MNPNIRIKKAIKSCYNALDKLENKDGEDYKRLAKGDLDFAREYILSSIYLLVAEIEENEEGE